MQIATTYSPSYAAIKWSEIPSGNINGTNTSFSTQYTFQSNSLIVFLNGLRLEDDEFTEGDKSFNVVEAPITGDSIYCQYIRI